VNALVAEYASVRTVYVEHEGIRQLEEVLGQTHDCAAEVPYVLRSVLHRHQQCQAFHPAQPLESFQNVFGHFGQIWLQALLVHSIEQILLGLLQHRGITFLCEI
jgi:hypothetical protein